MAATRLMQEPHKGHTRSAHKKHKKKMPDESTNRDKGPQRQGEGPGALQVAPQDWQLLQVSW